MDLNLNFWIQIGSFLLMGSAIYWRMHYKTNELAKESKEHKTTIESLQKREDELFKEIAYVQLEVEKRLNNSEKLLSKRLTRIEKILIRIDERMKFQATKDLEDEEE
ncbi:MAG: hypothetical protein FWH53_00185 [Leptospirales bacterium]|nr:hypothetical protein [Leptospirales bacterium]